MQRAAYAKIVEMMRATSASLYLCMYIYIYKSNHSTKSNPTLGIASS